MKKACAGTKRRLAVATAVLAAVLTVVTRPGLLRLKPSLEASGYCAYSLVDRGPYQLLDLSSRRQHSLRYVRPARGVVRDFALSSDGSVLIIAREREEIWLYQPGHGDGRFLCRGSGPLALSPDGRFLAYTAGLGAPLSAVCIRDLVTLGAQTTQSHIGYGSMLWLPDSRSLVFQDPHRGISVLDRETGARRRLLSRASKPGLTANGEQLIYLDEKLDRWCAYDLSTGRSDPVAAGSVGEIVFYDKARNVLVLSRVRVGLGGERTDLVLHHIPTREEAVVARGLNSRVAWFPARPRAALDASTGAQ